MTTTTTATTPKAHHLFFTGFGRVSAAQVQRYAQAGCVALIVGVNNEDDDDQGLGASDLRDGFAWRHGPSGGPDNLALALDEAQKHGLKVIPMIWARPTEPYLERSAEALERFLAHPAFGGVCHDLERYWHKLLAPAKIGADEAAALWLQTWGRDGVKAWITDYAGMPASAGALLGAALRAGVDAYAIPQAYSRKSWAAKDRVWEPPNTQNLARKTWGACLVDAVGTQGAGRLACGLAAYDLGAQPTARMSAQLQAATSPDGPHRAQVEARDGAAAVAWWSTAAAGNDLPALLGLVQATRAPTFPALTHAIQPPRADAAREV